MPGPNQDGGRVAASGREVDERTRFIFRQVPGAIWSVDRELRITHFIGRPAFTRSIDERNIVGVTVEEMLGTTDPANTAIAHHRAAVSGRSVSFQYEFLGRIYAIHLEPIRDRSDAITGACGIAIDATKRIHAMRDLRRSVSLLRATLEATEDGILVVDRQGRVAAYNQRFLDLWNVPANLAARGDDRELLAHVVGQLEDPDEFIRRVQELYREPAIESTDRVAFKSGRILTRYSCPQRVGDEVVGRVWRFRDVTEREQMLQCAVFLADASRLLASLDVEQAIEAMARRAVPMFGDACAVDLFGDGEPRRVVEIGPEDMVFPDVPQSLFSGRSVICRKGRGAYLSVPLRAHGKVLGAITLVSLGRDRFDKHTVGLAEDLGQRAALAVENAHIYRQSKEALGARDELLSVAAHEIRGPATSIHLAAQSLKKRHPEDEAQRQIIEIIEREDRRLARFVEDLVDVGRIRTGALRFDLEEVDLVDVVRQVAVRLGPELARAGSPLALTTDASVMGHWDRARLDQIAFNLLSNAIRFGRGQPIDVAVTTADGQAVLVVRDRGIGIAPEFQERIFARYERAAVGRHYGGLGLGLYIVRTIVDAIGGEIRVESTPGGGSTFTVELPRHAPQPASNAASRGA